MQIKSIEIKNIRNIEQKKIIFDKNNIILGENASGKTTIAEAIYYCCFFKSFRTKKQEEIINFKKDNAFIILKYENETKLNTIQINFYKNKKKFFFNQKEIKNIFETLNKFKCILITPTNIDLIEDSANKRRKYLNILLSQYDVNYLKNLINYNKLIKIKSKLLKNYYLTKKIDETYLNILNQKIVTLNQKIISLRVKILEKIELSMNNILKEITNQQETIKLMYNEKLKNSELDKIHLKELKEFKILKGNHLDDFDFILNEKSTKIFGSQGQKRLITLAFFLSQKDLNDSEYLLIFDDVSIDLDKKRQKRLINYLQKSDQNIYITTDILKVLIKDINKQNLNIINMS